MAVRHYLQPLLAPRSVALIGATERPGALGSIVWHSLTAAELHGEIYAVNSNGTGLVRLTHNKFGDNDPVWS